MPAFALGLFSGVSPNEDIAAYLRQIDATLAPHGGQFLVHGARAQVMEGEFAQDVVLIGFPQGPFSMASVPSKASSVS